MKNEQEGEDSDPVTKDKTPNSQEDENSGDEGEDGDMGTGLKHSRRLKSVGTEAMPFRVSGQDYEASAGEKKGRYGVTVPKPFAFDIRDKVRPKSIREKKVENMLEL